MDDAMMMRNISWVVPYLESPWVKAMGIFAPSFPPPGAVESSEAFRHFAAACAGSAVLLALFGAMAAMAVLLRSLYCCGRREQSSQPALWPLVCMGVMTLLLTLGGMFVYLLVGRKGVGLTMDSVSRTASAISSAALQGERLGVLGREASVALNSTIPKCKEEVQSYLRDFQQQLESYRGIIDHYNADMKGIPEQLGSMHSTLDKVSDFGMYSLMAPLALVLLCCFAITVVVHGTRSARGSGRCRNCCIRSLGLVLFAPAILLVGLVTAAEFGLGLATASFCKDADTNALTYIQHFAGDLTYNVSRYYISDVGTNPLLDQLHKANETIVNLETTVDQFGDIVVTQCQGARPAVQNLSAALKSVHAPLERMDEVLSPANLYPLYKTAIHDDMCTTVVSGVAWLVLMQSVVGIICLPQLTRNAGRFLDRWEWYQTSPPSRGLLFAGSGTTMCSSGGTEMGLASGV